MHNDGPTLILSAILHLSRCLLFTNCLHLQQAHKELCPNCVTIIILVCGLEKESLTDLVIS